MEGGKNIFIIVCYLLVIAIFPSYLLYLFVIKETASLSLVSIFFIIFMGVVDIILISFLFSPKFRNIFLLE